jgi:hypothetical protein
MSDEDKVQHGRWGGMATGLVVVVVGVLFLADNLGLHLPFRGLHNWWALFILIPVVALLAEAGARYRRVGRVDRAVLHLLLSAVAPLLVASFFLLELDWAVWWPLFVIYGGLWAMLGSRKRAAAP